MTLAQAPPVGNVAGMVSEVLAARGLGVSRNTFRKYVAAGLIARVEMPLDVRRNLYRVADLEAFAQSLELTTEVRQKTKKAS